MKRPQTRSLMIFVVTNDVTAALPSFMSREGNNYRKFTMKLLADAMLFKTNKTSTYVIKICIPFEKPCVMITRLFSNCLQIPCFSKQIKNTL